MGRMGRVVRERTRPARLWVHPRGLLVANDVRADLARSPLAAVALSLTGRSLSGCDRGRGEGFVCMRSSAGGRMLHCHMTRVVLLVVCSRSVVRVAFQCGVCCTPSHCGVRFGCIARVYCVLLCAAGGVLTEMCRPEWVVCRCPFRLARVGRYLIVIVTDPPILVLE